MFQINSKEKLLQVNSINNFLFLFQTAEHVRFRKRVELLIRNGVEAEVLAFERRAYPGKVLNCKYSSLGNIKHRNYFSRVLPFIAALKKMRKSVKNNQVIYAFGLDMLLLGWISSIGMQKKMVYEVGDIREVLIGNGIKQRLFRWLERFLLNRISLLIITSEAYLIEYFQKIQRVNNVQYLVVENKLDKSWSIKLSNNHDVREKSDSIVIGYFGVLRCVRSWEILKNIAENSGGAFQVYLRGISREINLQESVNYKYVTYDGPYLVPDDLPNMYNTVDLVWACYPYQGSSTGNWQWAKTVRFYESCFFKKPVIVQKGTEDSKLVNFYDIGLIVDMNQGVEKVVKQIRNITNADIQKWEHNMTKLPENIYLYSDEHERIVEALR